MSAHPTLSLLKAPAVRRYVLSRFCRATAQTGLGATLSWHVYEITGEAFSLGVLGVVQFLPVIPIGLLGGALADARERVGIVQWAQGCAALVAIALAAVALDFVASPFLAILALALVAGVSNAFENPAAAALLPNLVEASEFPSAVTLVAAVRNAAWASGPVLAGGVIHSGGVHASYLVQALLIGVSVAALGLMGRRIHAPEGGRVSLEAVREGVRFVARKPVILGAMTLDLFAVIFAGATALLPVFATDILEVGPRGYGLLSGALQVGTFGMALLLLILPPIRRPGRALLWAIGAFGLATLVFGVSRSFPLSMLALALAGMADEISMVARTTLIQLSTPDELRGRVSAVNFVFIGASNQLGSAESGFLAALTSATFSVVFGSAACLVSLGVIGAQVPELRDFEVGRADHGS